MMMNKVEWLEMVQRALIPWMLQWWWWWW